MSFGRERTDLTQSPDLLCPHTAGEHRGAYGRHKILPSVGEPVRYDGKAPFGSCHLQCVANLLAWRGIDNPDATMCTAWGFSWPGGTGLRGSGRWLDGLRKAYSLDIAERRYQSFAQAHSAEQDSLAAGYPVAAAVDAWFIPSPFEKSEHIAHCVLLVGTAGEDVWITDPMNRPVPARYSIVEWKDMRSSVHTDGFRTFFVRSSPRARPSLSCLLRRLAGDVRSHQDSDDQVLADFLEFCAGGHGGVIDVSEVAAERLYLAKLLRHASAEIPALAPAADRLLALARRWYLAHSIARESAAAQRPGPRSRDVRLLRELGTREAEDRQRLAALLAASSGRRRADG